MLLETSDDNTRSRSTSSAARAVEAPARMRIIAKNANRRVVKFMRTSAQRPGTSGHMMRLSHFCEGGRSFGTRQRWIRRSDGVPAAPAAGGREHSAAGIGTGDKNQ